MKKLFTLIATALMAQASFADTTIASFTFPDADMTANGTDVAGTGCTVTYTNVGFNSSGALNKKLNDTYYYHKMNNNNSPITIKLTSGSFQAGDVFRASLYSGSKSTDGFCFKTGPTENGKPTAGSNYKTITYSNSEENWLEYTLTDDDINNDGSLSVYRYSTNCYVRQIEVTRPDGVTRETPTTAFASAIVGFKASGSATSQTVTTNSDGAVTYESSNTNVVTVDASTGALTAVAPGKATITAKTATSSSYTSSTATYTVYVLSDGDGTLENAYLPTDFRYLSETYVPQYTEVDGAQVETSVKAWVVGYIVGVYNSGTQDIKIITSTTTSEGTIGLGNTASETVGSNCLAVQLISDSTPRADLNLKTNSGNLGKKVWVYGRVGTFTTSSQTVYGLRHADDYSWDGTTTAGIQTLAPASTKAAGKVYNLSGMEVANPTKGIYIKDGKKVVLK